MPAQTRPINLQDCFTRFHDHWSPKIIAEANGWHFKLVKAEGEFVWHEHPDTDEVFLLVSGSLDIALEGRDDVTLGPGDMFVVPRGVRHRPSTGGCEMMLLEPAGVPNTGGVDSELSNADEWLA